MTRRKDRLGITPTVRYDEAKKEWIAHFEERPWVVANIRCKSEAEAWATINGTAAPKVPVDAGEAIQRIASQMAKAAKGAV
jgi:hypothetical protein